ncbi:hypothetical protein H0H93_003412 [Arthromyces matolae]|nr:hypothetical protein H0H93_003412 [Arthromyces matolae]
MLPTELLNQAFFIHSLATDPSSVLPPNKSLLAMMADAPTAPKQSALHARVERVVHQAFWDEALKSLSSPLPTIQLPRLKLLYGDLRDALVSLFPPDHPVLVTLAAPLSPTSSPLHSTLSLLKEVLISLRQRCAPVRDPDIDALLANIDTSPPSGSLAAVIVSILRDLIALTDVLKRDLSSSLLGVMSEAQLADVIRRQACTRERELTLHPSMWQSKQNIQNLWTSWLGSESSWTARLLRALTSPTPVACDPDVSHTHPNHLPPHFFFTHATLLYLQNYLQALVITASLKALVKLPSSPQDMTSRIWTLLKAEIDQDSTANNKADGIDESTKLVHLADEVIRAQRLYSSPNPTLEPQTENALRSAVDRTLRLRDPVFALLQARLVRAIGDQTQIYCNVDMSCDLTDRITHVAPETMRTGRTVSPPRADTPSSSASNSYTSRRGTPRDSGCATVKGFEDEVLVHAIGEVLDKLVGVVQWVNIVWGDVISASPGSSSFT